MTNQENIRKERVTIRVGKNTLSFSTADVTNREQPISYEPYVVRSGISMAANLREAFKTTNEQGGSGALISYSEREADLQNAKSSEILALGLRRVRVLVDAPFMLVPVEQFNEQTAETLFRHSFPRYDQLSVAYNVIPSLNAVAVFGVNKDLLLVVTDHFDDVQLIHAMSPVWNYLHRRSFTGHRNKLYGYFHDKQLDIFSFQQNRFKFCNAFETSRANDSLYFLLYVWKQLNLQPEHDEMHLVGDIPDKDWLLGELRKYLQKAYVINPTAEFNRAPATLIKGMPFDLMTLYTKGR